MTTRVAKLRISGTLAAAFFLGGCSVGIKGNGAGAPSTTFHVGMDYQATYRLADQFARACHKSTSFWKDSFEVSGNVFAEDQAAAIHVSAPRVGTDLERIDIKAARSGGSDVTVTAWGHGLWDQAELVSAQRSIESGAPTCR